MSDNIWHPDKSRAMTMNEMKRLCGYPDNYVFVEERKNESFAQMTKAVMPASGEYLAMHVRKAVDNNKSLSTLSLSRKTMLYDFRKQDVPKIVELKEVFFEGLVEKQPLKLKLKRL